MTVQFKGLQIRKGISIAQFFGNFQFTQFQFSFLVSIVFIDEGHLTPNAKVQILNLPKCPILFLIDRDYITNI